MKRAGALLLLLVGCTTATPPPAQPRTPTVTPRFAPTAQSQRVVLVSCDALGADALAQQTDIPAFTKMAAEGTRARVIPVNPTVTTTTHSAILTGAGPDVTGVVANRYHKAGTPRNEQMLGFDADLDAETFVEAARKAGKRTGSLMFPMIDQRTPRRQTDFSINWSKTLTKPRLLHLKRADFHREWAPPGWPSPTPRHTSFSPVLKTRIEWSLPQRARADVDLVAYDTTNDNAENYDAWFVESDAIETPVAANGWFSVARTLDDGVYGSWSKVMHFDPALTNVTVYWGGIAHTVAQPAAFREMLDREVGFWPGPQDDMSAAEMLAGGDGIDFDTFNEQTDREADFVARATALTIRNMPFDLLLVYQPVIDTAYHQFLIVLDTQPNATPENKAGGERVRRNAFTAADRSIGMMMRELDPARDTLIVTGDHGMAAVDTEIRLNRWLTENGLADRWSAFASGNIVHFYRFGDPDDSDKLVKLLTDSQWFERIERKSATSHPNTGDVYAFAWPHLSLTGGMDAPVLVKPRTYGQHGGLNTHTEFHTALFAWGAGVPRTSFNDLSQTEIAPFVRSLLGLPNAVPPRAASATRQSR